MKRSPIASVACVASALAFAAPANAQEAQPTGVEEVVVTAQKTASAESAQRVPLAITAVSANTIADIQAVSVMDVARVAPNTQLQAASTMPGFANFAIRGIGASGSVSSIDPAVNIIVDGMVYDFQGATIIDTFDVEAVEILRGPQGILFGRNTTGGAVSIRTKRPRNDLEARGEVTLGNFDRLDLSGMVSGAVVPDKLLVKFSALRRSHDGYFIDRNGGTFTVNPNNPSGTEPGTIRGRNPEADTVALRPTLIWKPAESVDVALLGEYVRIEGGSSAAQPVPAFASALQTRFGYTPPSGEWENNNNLDGYTDTRAYRLVGEINADVGPGVLTSVTGYRNVDYDFAFDADGTPFTIIDFPDNSARSHQYSEELRFASTFSDRVRFTVGGYYDNHELDLIEKRRLSLLLANPAATSDATLHLQGFYTQKTRSTALFANVDFNLTDALTLTAGGRYSWETKKLDIVPIGACAGPQFSGCASTTTAFKRSWSDFSPKVGAQYQLSEDVLLYASWTKGFRSGNFNGRATSLAQVGPADPESAASTEVGFKSTFWDRKARVNVALFQTEYDDIQRQVLIGLTQVLTNAASAKIRGVEAEVTLNPLPGLELDGSFGYTDAKYDSFENLNVNGVPGIQPEDAELAKHLEFDRVPKYTAYGAAAYTLDVPGIDRGITARVDYSYRSHFFTDVVNTPALAQQGYGLLGASLTAEWNNLRLTAFGRNLTDKHYIDLANTLIVPIRYGGEPRTYGVALALTF